MGLASSMEFRDGLYYWDSLGDAFVLVHIFHIEHRNTSYVCVRLFSCTCIIYFKIKNKNCALFSG